MKCQIAFVLNCKYIRFVTCHLKTGSWTFWDDTASDQPTHPRSLIQSHYVEVSARCERKLTNQRTVYHHDRISLKNRLFWSHAHHICPNTLSRVSRYMSCPNLKVSFYRVPLTCYRMAHTWYLIVLMIYGKHLKSNGTGVIRSERLIDFKLCACYTLKVIPSVPYTTFQTSNPQLF